MRATVNRAMQHTRELLRDKMSEIEAVAQRLLEREVLTRADMIKLLGVRPFKEAHSYEEMVEGAFLICFLLRVRSILVQALALWTRTPSCQRVSGIGTRP